jgi:uncharacterized protein with von Willebrand factor type A (vWA) domain
MSTPDTTEILLQASSVIQHDSFDERAYQDALHMHPRLQEVVTASGGLLPSASPLIEDTFYSLFQPAPRLLSESEITLSSTVNRAILEQMMLTTQWEELRQAGTIGDSLYSGLATASVTKAVLSSLGRETVSQLKELAEAEREAHNLMEEAEALDDMASVASGDRAEDLYQQAEEARKRAQEEQERAEQVNQALTEEIETIEDATRQAAREVLEEAQDEVESMMAALKTFTGGYDEDTPNTPRPVLTLKERVKLAATVEKSAKLKQVAELCGRLTRIALECQKVRVLHPPDEVVGITIGDDLSKLLPQELVLLTDPDLELLFYQRYLEKSLMQIDMRGSEKQGRGDLIVSVDSSGSMAWTLGTASYSKEAWAKAVALALLAIARKQKRNLVMIHYAEHSQLKTYTFPKGEASSKDLLTVTEFFFNGNDTQYEPWMREALKILDAGKFDKADVIHISDGLAHVSRELEAEWNTHRKQRGMRCYSVLLGNQGGASVLGSISDAIVTIENLAQDNQALQTMFSI